MILAQRTGLIGVDIGASTIKLAQLVRRADRLELAEAQIVKRRSPWLLGDPSATSPMRSSDEIQAGMSLGTGFQGRRSAGLFPMPLCGLHTLRMAAADRSPEPELVSRLLEAETPGSLHGAVVQHWVAPHGEANAEEAGNRVYVMTAPAQWSDCLAADFRKNRLSCSTFDGLPLALARVLEFDPQHDPNKPAIAIDWGFTQATFCACRDGRPMYVRSLKNSGFHRIVSALQQALGISEDDAIAVLAQKGIPDSRHRNPGADAHHLIGELLRQPLADFVSELQRTLSHGTTQQRDVAPQGIWLFGGGATVANIDAYLRKHVDVPITVWRQSFGDEKFAKELACLFGPAIALSALAWEGI